jgi:Sigma-70 region 2
MLPLFLFCSQFWDCRNNLRFPADILIKSPIHGPLWPQETELNIEPAAEPDPWPRHGLAAAYKPFILKRIKTFLENNRHLDRNEIITDAIRLTWECSQKFKPELGLDFSTYLRHWLPNRLYDTYRIEKSESVETEMELPVAFLGGGNGAGLILDTGFLAIGVKMGGNGAPIGYQIEAPKGSRCGRYRG